MGDGVNNIFPGENSENQKTEKHQDPVNKSKRALIIFLGTTGAISLISGGSCFFLSSEKNASQNKSQPQTKPKKTPKPQPKKPKHIVVNAKTTPTENYEYNKPTTIQNNLLADKIGFYIKNIKQIKYKLRFTYRHGNQIYSKLKSQNHQFTSKFDGINKLLENVFTKYFISLDHILLELKSKINNNDKKIDHKYIRCFEEGFGPTCKSGKLYQNFKKTNNNIFLIYDQTFDPNKNINPDLLEKTYNDLENFNNYASRFVNDIKQLYYDI